MLKSLASIAIYSAVRALLFLVGLIPVPVGYWLCDRVARVGYTLSRARRNRGLGNVRRAFPELSAAEHIAMVKASFRNIIRVGYELILAPRLLGPGTVHECAVVKGIEHVASAHSAGVGSVLVGSHFGNWEIAGAIMGLLGYPITAVARGMEDRRFDLLLKKLRELYGLKVIGIRGAVQKGRSLIAEGEKLYFTADQHAREGRIWIPFFGQPAAWTKTPASLARRSSAQSPPGPVAINSLPTGSRETCAIIGSPSTSSSEASTAASNNSRRSRPIAWRIDVARCTFSPRVLRHRVRWHASSDWTSAARTVRMCCICPPHFRHASRH